MGILSNLVSSIAIPANRARSKSIDDKILSQFDLAEISQVTFYKLDQITTDLVCCEIEVHGKFWTFHEDLEGWNLLIEHLEKLPGFRSDWPASVVKPAFATNKFTAFLRSQDAQD